MRFSTLITAAAIFVAGVAAQATQRPSAAPQPGAIRVQGCWGSQGSLELVNGSVIQNTDGACGTDICTPLKKKVAALYQGNKCYCGDNYPPKNAVVDDSECNVPCPGFPSIACGGTNAFTVINTGVDAYAVSFDPEPSSSATSQPSATSGPSTPGTSAAQPSETSSSGGGTNTAAVAAGVVVGIVAIAAIAGGIWFFMRKKRNAEIEEEHRRNAAVNAFINNGSVKGPSSSSGMSMTDARMNPSLNDRRMSSGSIADNQDYSRRILRVTNA